MPRLISKRNGIIFVVIVLFICSLAQAQPDTFTITILHSNDFHGANMELLAKRAAVINKIRAEEIARGTNSVLTLDAGDVFTRGPYQKRFYGALEFAIMNEIHYDAVTLGNNEFKGADDLSAQKILMERIKQAEFPMLSANVFDKKSGSLLPGTQAYVIKIFGDVKVAIFGVTSTKIAFYNQTKGWKVTDPINASESIVNELAGKADIILALTHIGVAKDRALAKKVNKINAIIGGDSHTVLEEPEMAGNIPIVQAGDNGKFLGRLDLTFQKGEAGWKLREARGELINLNNTDITPDPAVMKIIDDYLKEKEAA